MPGHAYITDLVPEPGRRKRDKTRHVVYWGPVVVEANAAGIFAHGGVGVDDQGQGIAGRGEDVVRALNRLQFSAPNGNDGLKGPLIQVQVEGECGKAAVVGDNAKIDFGPRPRHTDEDLGKAAQV